MSENYLYECVGILLLIDILSILYMLLVHCNLGTDTYGWKWDSERNENITLGLLISSIVMICVLVAFRTIEVIGI